MFSKSTLLLTIALVTITGVYFSINSNTNQISHHLQNQPINNLQFTFKSISSILRTTLTRIYALNDTIYVGDNVGSVAIWTYDSKKKSLDFQDVSRQIAAVLPPQNKVLHLQAIDKGVLVLTQNGKITAYQTNSQSKILDHFQLLFPDSSSWFTFIKLANNTGQIPTVQVPLIVAIINKNKSNLCLYSIKQSFTPNQPIKLLCNQSKTANVSYQHVSFDSLNNLISVGDQNKVVIFKLNISAQGNVSMSYLTQANLPKAEVKGFKSIFSNGTLLAINDLWLSSILIDQTVPSARVISAERTQKIIKQGSTTDISAYFDAKAKKSLVFINSKDRVQSFTLANNKLTYVNDSKVIGRCQNFLLRDQAQLFASVGVGIQALKIGPDNQDYLAVQNQYSIQSANHFKPVKTMSLWNNTFLVSASESSKQNFKLWNYTASTYKLTLSDQKSISFFSILKSGYITFLASLWIPPPAKSTALHVAIVGADPFSLYIVPVSSQGKLGTVFRSKDQHSNNVTTILLSADQKQIITGSMDTTIKIWTLTANHNQVQDNTTTIPTKNGPIRVGLQDKTATYYAFGHSSNIFNPLVNISIWKTDPKHGLVKLAQNVPGQAHQSNLTALVLSTDQKYLISLSESGQMRLWRLQNWTMVDLLASLGLGVFDATLQTTKFNSILIQTQKFFAQYYYDINGFLLLARQTKTFTSVANSSLVQGKTWFSGDMDGSIRIYTFEE